MVHDDFDLIDNEEMIRFQKALSKCRNCGHAKMIHYFLNNKNKCIDFKLEVNGKYKGCHCIRWEPADNLEYLESKYDIKKGKK